MCEKEKPFPDKFGCIEGQWWFGTHAVHSLAWVQTSLGCRELGLLILILFTERESYLRILILPGYHNLLDKYQLKEFKME